MRLIDSDIRTEVLLKLADHMQNIYEPQTYITEDRDTQILDAWQVKLQTEREGE